MRKGFLRVLGYAGWDAKGQSVLWLCQCDCGERTVIRTSTLRHSKQKTCGCKMWGRKHGHTCGKSLTYSSWLAMRGRCFNPKNQDYKNYGARGITVCARWLGKHGFENFLADMGLRLPGKTLDRENPNGNYTPENCRWASNYMQAVNKRPRTKPGNHAPSVQAPIDEFTGLENPF